MLSRRRRADPDPRRDAAAHHDRPRPGRPPQRGRDPGARRRRLVRAGVRRRARADAGGSRGAPAGAGPQRQCRDQAVERVRRRSTGEVVADCCGGFGRRTGRGCCCRASSGRRWRAARRARRSIPRGLLAGPAAVRLGAGACRRWAAPPCISTIGGSARRELRELAAAGVPVLLYTVNDAARARELLAAGAVAVITDVPDLLPLSSGASTPPAGPGS